VDPITARRVLRIFPDSPITVELIERAYASESQARHPSRYQDAAERQRAEEWMQTLATARDLLRAEARTPEPRADAAAAPGSSRRRLSRGAIVGIVAGSAAVLALVTFAAIGAANLVTQSVTAATDAIESEAPEDTPITDGQSGATDDVNVERLESGETFFAFPAALEAYYDGRYTAECPLEYANGCWEQALFPEADCDTMQVQLGFTNDAEGFLPEHTETIEKKAVLANEATVVVFGNDDYGYGWINQVTCLDDAS
jgi:hypothetical protein